MYPVPSRWTGGGAAPISSLPDRAVKWGGRSGPGLMASFMTEFFQIARMSTPTLRGLRAQSGRPGRAHPDSGGGAR